FFVRGFTEALNIEMEKDGIQVSAILVAYVKTPMVDDAPVKAASIKKLGVKIQPQLVAETVWKAAHGKRVLWRIGFDAKALNLAVRMFGTAGRPIVKKLTGY